MTQHGAARRTIAGFEVQRSDTGLALHAANARSNLVLRVLRGLALGGFAALPIGLLVAGTKGVTGSLWQEVAPARLRHAA